SDSWPSMATTNTDRVLGRSGRTPQSRWQYPCCTLGPSMTTRPGPVHPCAASPAGAAGSGVCVRTSAVSMAASNAQLASSVLLGSINPSGIDGDVGLFVGRGFGEVLADDGDQFVELGSAAVEKLLPRDHSSLAAITIRVVPLEVQSNDGAPPKHCHLGKVSPRVKTLVEPLRSEERRVGKECSSRWRTYNDTKIR